MSVTPDYQLDALQQRLGHRFTDTGLLVHALTHSSHSKTHNERLEFLGDSLLGASISMLLFQSHADADEGALSRLRTRLVRGETLAEIARELALGDCLRLGLGERKSGGRLRASILADALEALLAAVYLDAGINAVQAVVERLFQARIDQLPDAESLKDPKTRLQELLQARGLELPQYELLDQSGPDHDRRFTISCRLSAQNQSWQAEAASRRKAEQKAATAALRELQQ
ncbi:MAG: ribonuclease III [Gammaproteobacteria bacterium]|jgi:ribonuclease-3|nr:ribonuclease III [Gammaproteobacteria bacterium]